MRFSLNSSVLSSKLNILSKVISPKNSMQILDCILFEVENNVLTLTASDNANVMTAEVGLEEFDGNGSFCIPAKIIISAVKELSEQPLVFNVNSMDYSVDLQYQNGAYRVMGQSAVEYPRMQQISGDYTQVTMPSEVLSANIARSIFATAQDELRMVMNGLYFDLHEDSLAIVASDGHKLVRNRIYNCGADAPASFILPKKPATLLRNVLANDGSDVVIKFNAANAEVVFEGGILACRLIEGRYPNYNSVIPKENPNRATVDRKSLIGAMRRVLPFASESTQLLKLRFEMNNLEINAEDIDFSTSARENIACEYGGMPMSIGFKGSAIYDICNNLSSDDIIVELADPSRAGIISPAEQPENQDVLMLVMPMLLND